MKKIIVLLLSTALALGLLTGCGTAAPASSTATPAASSGSSVAEEVKTSGNKLERVVIVLPSPRGDSGTMDSVCKGVERLQKAEGFELRVVEVGDYATEPAKLEAALLDISEDNWDFILTCGSSMNDVLAAVAPQFPENHYATFDTTYDFTANPTANVYAGNFLQNEGAYLAGALAMSMSKTGVAGFVGGVETPVINDFLWGYAEGAQAVKADAKINIAYTANWSDSAKAKELALTQISMDSDVIFPAAGPASNGAMEACKEKNVYSIGVDIDRAEQYKADPAMVASILSSALKNVDVAAERACKLFESGELVFGKQEALGLREGCVGLAKNDNYNALVPEAVRKSLDELEAKIVAGEIKVGSAIGKTAEEIQKIKDSVSK